MFADFSQKFQQAIQTHWKPEEWAWGALKIALILLGAWLLIRIVSAITGGVIARQKKRATSRSRRVGSLMTLTRSFIRYFVYFVAIALIFSVIGKGSALTSLLATAGIGGLAIGFGAQNLVRDVVTGLFLMFENQYAVGDYINVDGAEGTVEAVALRTTYLRTYLGERHIIPNGSIQHVINYSNGDFLAMVEIGVSYDCDVKQVMDIMDGAVKDFAKSRTDVILESPSVVGVVALADTKIVIRIVCKVQAMSHWEVERGLRLAVVQEFTRRGIPFPYPRSAMEVQRVQREVRDQNAAPKDSDLPD